MRKTCAEATIECLTQLGVEHVFGIASGKMMPFMQAMSAQTALSFTGTRHEAAGAMMASGIYLGTGKLSCAMGELGPGGSNLIPGVANAFADNIPMIVITTALPLHVASPSRGMLMDLDLDALFQPVTKASYRILDGRRTPEIIYRAGREALSGRPGPVHISIPADILGEEFNFNPTAFSEKPRVQIAVAHPDPAAISKAAEILSDANKPLIIAGGGVMHAGADAEITAISDILDAPAMATQMGIGAVSSDHMNFIGHGGTISGDAVVQALKNADVILAVGCRFSSWLWGPLGPIVAEGVKIIQIDSDPQTLGQLVPVDVPILADAKIASGAVLRAIANTPKSETRQAWRDNLVAQRIAWSTRLKTQAKSNPDCGNMHPAAVTFALNELLPDRALVTYDGGHTTFWHNDIISAHATRTRLHAPGLAQLGCGSAYAIGLKRAFPERPVICTTGDGSFGFTIQELDTARRYGLPVIFIIHNNQAWGVIRAGQSKAGFEFGTDLSGTDYASIARGFGCNGVQANTLDDFRAAFTKALTAKLPTVIECKTAFVPHPALKYFGAGSGTANPPADAMLPI